jgi:putative peptidoglycan lipid II flippase
MALALWPFVRGTGYRFRWRFRPRDPAVRRVIRLAGWTVGYVAVNQVALWVVLVLANGEAGGVSAYLGAYVFFILPHGLLTTSIMTALSPDLASAWNARDSDLARARATTGLRLIVATIVPAAAVQIALGRPIVTALLQRGEFSAQNAAVTGNLLALFGIGLVAFSVYLFALRVLYASADTRTPFLLNCVQNAANVGLAIWWYQLWGVRGLALAFSVSYILASTLALGVVSRRLHGLEWGPLASVITRVGAVALFAGLGAWFTAETIGYSGSGRALVATIAGLGVAGVIVGVGYVTFRIEEAKAMLAMLRDRRPRGTISESEPLSRDAEAPGVER